MEKEEPDKVSAFKIMLYYATGAALLVIPDWLPMKSTARHQENGRCHMAGNRSDSLSLEPVVTLKDFTDILLCQSFFKSKIQQTGFQRFILRNIIILLFYHVCFIEWNETVSFIIPENLFLIVCIHHDKTASCLVVLMTEPVFYESHQLPSYVA